MMKMLILAGVCGLTIACGGSPTGPTATREAKTVAVVAPEPTSAPEAIPEPPPVPAPAPPSDAIRFRGEVGQAHWYGPAIFSGHFELAIYHDHIEASGHGWDILARTPDGWTAGTRNVDTLIIESRGGAWAWTYNGLAGQASGSLVPQ